MGSGMDLEFAKITIILFRSEQKQTQIGGIQWEQLIFKLCVTIVNSWQQHTQMKENTKNGHEVRLLTVLVFKDIELLNSWMM